MKVMQPYRSPGEYSSFRAGVRACAALFSHYVGKEAHGGGIPNELIVKPCVEIPVTTALPKDAPDVYEAEAETADTGDAPDAAADTQ